MTSHSTSRTSSPKEENEKLLDKNFTIVINKHLGKGGLAKFI